MTTRSSAALAQRWVVSLHLIALIAQLALALMVLAGDPDAPALHGNGAWVVLTLGAGQALVLLVLPWHGAHGRIWKAAALLLPVCEAAQIHLGQTQNLPYHVTLGIIIWGTGMAFLIQVWAPSWGIRTAAATV